MFGRLTGSSLAQTLNISPSSKWEGTRQKAGRSFLTLRGEYAKGLKSLALEKRESVTGNSLHPRPNELTGGAPARDHASRGRLSKVVVQPVRGPAPQQFIRRPRRGNTLPLGKFAQRIRPPKVCGGGRNPVPLEPGSRPARVVARPEQPAPFSASVWRILSSSTHAAAAYNTRC